MSEKPSVVARLVDAAALALVAAGAVVYMNAHSGMSDILASHVRVPTRASLNFDRWLHFRTMSRVGLGLVFAGVLVGVAAFYGHRRPTAIPVLPAADPALDPALDISPNATTE